MKLFKLSVGVTTTFIALMGILYTINSDVVIDHDNDFFYPLKSLFKSHIEEKSIEELIGIKDEKESAVPEERIYIFVLDVSRSLRLKTRFPGWYFDTIDSLNRKTSGNRFDVYKYRSSAFDLCKMNLFQNLLEIEGLDINFLIYTLGNEAKKIYPTAKGMATAAKEDIIEAIEIIHENKEYPNAYNTDFTDLFDLVYENYLKDSRSYSENKKKFPPVKLLIISDLFHDIEPRLKSKLSKERVYRTWRKYKYIREKFMKELKREIDEDREKLNDSINKILRSNLSIDFIVLEEAIHAKPKENETYIWSLLKKKYGGKSIKKISIVDYYSKCLLKAIMRDSIINLNYSGDIHKIKSSFRIRLKEYGKYKFGLETQVGNIHKIKGDLKFQVLDSNNNILQSGDKIGYLLSNGKNTGYFELEELELEGCFKIQLDYIGELPYNQRLPDFKIYLPRGGSAYYSIPICFKKSFSTGTRMIFSPAASSAWPMINCVSSMG